MLVSSLFLSKNKSARCVLDMGAGMNIKTLKFPKSFEVHYASFINYDKQVNFTLHSSSAASQNHMFCIYVSNGTR